ncbi:hypothetical protein LTR93_012400, partial [Exophiala xenobiotica]
EVPNILQPYSTRTRPPQRRSMRQLRRRNNDRYDQENQPNAAWTSTKGTMKPEREMEKRRKLDKRQRASAVESVTADPDHHTI